MILLVVTTKNLGSSPVVSTTDEMQKAPDFLVNTRFSGAFYLCGRFLSMGPVHNFQLVHTFYANTYIIITEPIIKAAARVGNPGNAQPPLHMITHNKQLISGAACKSFFRDKKFCKTARS